MHNNEGGCKAAFTTSVDRNTNCGFEFLHILYVHRWEASWDAILHRFHRLLVNWLALPGDTFVTWSILNSKSQNVLLSAQLLTKTRALPSIVIPQTRFIPAAASALSPHLILKNLQPSPAGWLSPRWAAELRSTSLKAASWTSCPDPSAAHVLFRGQSSIPWPAAARQPELQVPAHGLSFGFGLITNSWGP